MCFDKDDEEDEEDDNTDDDEDEDEDVDDHEDSEANYDRTEDYYHLTTNSLFVNTDDLLLVTSDDNVTLLCAFAILYCVQQLLSCSCITAYVLGITTLLSRFISTAFFI